MIQHGLGTRVSCTGFLFVDTLIYITTNLLQISLHMTFSYLLLCNYQIMPAQSSSKFVNVFYVVQAVCVNNYLHTIPLK